jgi:hypothetical protein
MATYGDMQTRIADELHRGGLTAPIKRAIVSAVKHHERRKFYFSETSFNFNTVAGQRNYGTAAAAAIATSPSIDRLNGTFYSLRDDLTKRPFEDIDQKTGILSFRAWPEEWAYYSQQIWLYPIPDAAYTLTAYSVPRLTELSADADENAWTNDAEELIRLRAKRELVSGYIGLSGWETQYAEWGRGEEVALVALLRETASRKATGFSTPTEF